jgi:hypothetical protein
MILYILIDYPSARVQIYHENRSKSNMKIDSRFRSGRQAPDLMVHAIFLGLPNLTTNNLADVGYDGEDENVYSSMGISYSG